jgi:hypothetical protein
MSNYYIIPAYCLNEPQKATLSKIASLSKAAHTIDIVMRINGDDVYYQTDFLKHLDAEKVYEHFDWGIEKRETEWDIRFAVRRNPYFGAK